MIELLRILDDVVNRADGSRGRKEAGRRQEKEEDGEAAAVVTDDVDAGPHCPSESGGVDERGYSEAESTINRDH